MDNRAVGILEVYGLVCAFMAADAGCKAANVTLDPFDKNKPANADSLKVPLLVTIKFRGSVDDVTAAVEAGRAVGLSYWTTMLKIVIPQAVKNILPTMGNEFITLIKETSVVSFVGAADLYVAFNYIGSNSYEFMVPYLVMAMIYIVLVLIISFGIKCMERSLRKSDRRN